MLILYFSETDSDDSINAPNPKSSPQKKTSLPKKKSALSKKSISKIEVKHKPQIQPSTSATCDNLLVPSTSKDNSIFEQVETSPDLSVQEVKLESVQEVIVPVIVPDQTGYASAAQPEIGSQEPEVGYYNFSFELLKSFSERFQGQVSIDGLLMSPLKLFPVKLFWNFSFS